MGAVMSAPAVQRSAMAAVPSPRSSLTLVLAAYAASNMTAYVRDATIAGRFGAGASTDAYFVSALIPTLLATLLIYESLVPVCLPAFARLRWPRDGESRMVGQVLFGTGIVLIAISGLLILEAPGAIHLLAAGWSRQEVATGAQLLRITGGSLVALGLGALVACVSNARHRYLAPPLGLAASNVVVCIATLGLSHRLGIFAPAWGLLVGSWLYLAVQAAALRRTWSRDAGGEAAAGDRPLQIAAVRSVPGVRQVQMAEFLPALLPMLLFAALAQSVPVVERWLSSGLPSGQLSYLTYAGKLMMSPILVITAATNLVSFVGLSHGNSGDMSAYRRELARGARVTSGLLLFATLTLILLRRPLVALALERGHFGAHDVAITATLVAIYALGLVPNGLSWLLYRSSQAQGRYRAALAVISLQTVGYIAISVVLFHRWKLYGLPAAFAIGQVIQLALLGAVHFRLLRPGFHAICRYSAGLVATVAVCVASERLWGPVLPVLLDRGTPGDIAALGLGASFIAVCCSGCAIVLGMPEAHDRLLRLRGKLESGQGVKAEENA